MFWVICFQNAALPQLFLRVLDPSLKPMRLKTQKSIQGLLYSPLLKHRLYWHIGKNFKDVRSFLPEKNGQSLLQEKKVHDLVILSCPENSQPPKIKETAPGTVYIYIPEKVGSKSTKSSCNLQLPFLNSAVASPFWTGIGSGSNLCQSKPSGQQQMSRSGIWFGSCAKISWIQIGNRYSIPLGCPPSQ